MKIFWTGIAFVFMALGVVGAVALVNMAVPFIQDPALDRVTGLLAIIYILIGIFAFFFWRGFQQPDGEGFWTRLAGVCKTNW